MKTEKELNADILKITMTIEEKFPELSKYLKEMPDPFSDSTSPDINNKNLQDYYDSLNALLNKYTVTHESETKQIT